MTYPKINDLKRLNLEVNRLLPSDFDRMMYKNKIVAAKKKQRKRLTRRRKSHKHLSAKKQNQRSVFVLLEETHLLAKR